MSPCCLSEHLSLSAGVAVGAQRAAKLARWAPIPAMAEPAGLAEKCSVSGVGPLYNDVGDHTFTSHAPPAVLQAPSTTSSTSRSCSLSCCKLPCVCCTALWASGGATPTAWTATPSHSPSRARCAFRITTREMHQTHNDSRPLVAQRPRRGPICAYSHYPGPGAGEL